jgi:serine/threonine protein kinase
MGAELRCPSTDSIASYLGGELEHSRLDGLEKHLDDCSVCARVVIEAAGHSHSAGAPVRARPRIFHPDQVIADRYEIVSFLGAGGMGEVYEAHDRELNDLIALKTVSAAISLDRAAVARFKAEAQLARKVTHRNVCRVFDLGIHAEKAEGAEPSLTPFLTMELIRGRSLSDHIRAGNQFTGEEALAISRQIARGLEAAHDAGVLHRDLKSDNVLLLPASREHFRVVITDFGLAAASFMGDSGAPAPSSSVSFYGTRPYLAPERLAGARATPGSDIYSLGVVMYELVTGSAVAISPASTRFEALSPSAPLAPIIRACLAAEPRQRLTSATDVLEALDGLQCAAPPEISSIGPRRQDRSERRLWWWALGSVVASAVAIAVAIEAGATGSRSPRQPVAASPTSPRQPVPDDASPPTLPAASAPTAVLKPHGRRPSRSVQPKQRVAPGLPHLESAEPRVPPAETASQLLESAEQHLRSGHIEEACVLGRDAADRAPDAPATWEFLGRCHMRLGEPREARAYYRRYLLLAPGSSNALFIRAMVEEKEDQP